MEVHEHQCAILNFGVVVANVREVHNVVAFAIFDKHGGPCCASAETHDEGDAPRCKEQKWAPVLGAVGVQ